MIVTANQEQAASDPTPLEMSEQVGPGLLGFAINDSQRQRVRDSVSAESQRTEDDVLRLRARWPPQAVKKKKGDIYTRAGLDILAWVSHVDCHCHRPHRPGQQKLGCRMS
jgi:hypothetical protein